MERLEPLEELVSDYYLGDHAGWYSDGEHQDSDSSNDELSEQISQLAGVRRCKQKPQRGDRRESRAKDEFESDMDDELDERLVAHASEFMQANTSASAVTTSAVVRANDMLLKKESNQEESMRVTEVSDQPASSGASAQGEGASASVGTSGITKKSVSFKEEPFEIGEANNQKTEGTGKGKTAFDDSNNLLRRMADRSMKGEKEEMEFYDANEDDDNEQWVREHRRRLGLFNDETKGQKADASFVGKGEKNDDTDAVLSCPACMTLLTRQCQRHHLYRNQYRAMFVENCKVVVEETVFMPESRRKKRKNANKCETAGPKPNTVVSASEASTLRREDLFHPVQCAVCSTAVGVYDVDEVFHFFNVLTGYA